MNVRPSFLLVLLFLACSTFSFATEPPDALVKQGQWKAARAVLEPRLKANPNDAHAHYLMSQVKAAFGDEPAAFQLAEKAVKLDGKNADYRFQLARMYGERAENAGIFSQMSLGRSFKKEVDAALAIDPRHVEANFALMLFYLKAPGLLGGDKKKAHQVADTMMTWSKVDGLYAKARLASEEKRTSELEGIYKKVLEADARNFQAHVNLGNIYLREKKYDLVEKHGKRAIELEPGRTAGYSLLAIAYANQKRFAEMEKVLLEAEAKVPNNLIPYYLAANSLLGMGENFPTAEQYFRKYMTQEPEGGAPRHAYANWRLGLLYEKWGKRDQARAELKTASRDLANNEALKKDVARLK